MHVDRTTATITLGLGFITVVLFMYILFMPLIKGEKPDVRVCIVPCLSRGLNLFFSSVIGDSPACFPRSFRYELLSSIPNYCEHRQYPQILTASIITGWTLLTYTLGRWSSLGYIKGTAAGPFLFPNHRFRENDDVLSIRAVCPGVWLHGPNTGSRSLPTFLRCTLRISSLRAFAARPYWIIFI